MSEISAEIYAYSKKDIGNKNFIILLQYMEPKFQTSFIPKTPISTASQVVKRASYGGSVSLLWIIGMILFVASLVAAGGLFLYGQYLDSQISADDKSLSLAKNDLDQQTMDSLVTASQQIQFAKNLLNHHVAVSNIFGLLEGNVLPQVSFTTFQFDSNSGVAGGGVAVSVDGEAASYAVLAEQSNIFSKISTLSNENFTNLDLTDKGTVKMRFQAVVDPKLLSYEQALSALSSPGTTQ